MLAFWTKPSIRLLHTRSNTVPGNKGCEMNKTPRLCALCKRQELFLSSFPHSRDSGVWRLLQEPDWQAHQQPNQYLYITHCRVSNRKLADFRNFLALNLIWRDHIYQTTRRKCISLPERVKSRFDFVIWGAVCTPCLHQCQRKMRFLVQIK